MMGTPIQLVNSVICGIVTYTFRVYKWSVAIIKVMEA